MYGFGTRSKDRYPKGGNGKNGSIPSAQANATNGQIVGPGSGDSYPNAKKGNNWPAPNNYATATQGQTTGHPSQKTAYPGKYPTGKKSSRVISSSVGKDKYSPKGGNML